MASSIWDPMPDVEGCEDYMESDLKLLQTKWNKDVMYVWRMYVDIEVQDEIDDGNKVESNKDEMRVRSRVRKVKVRWTQMIVTAVTNNKRQC